MAAAVLSFAPVATLAGTAPPEVVQRSVVAASAATAGPTSSATQVGQPWYSIPFLPVDSWNPYA